VFWEKKKAKYEEDLAIIEREWSGGRRVVPIPYPNLTSEDILRRKENR